MKVERIPSIPRGMTYLEHHGKVMNEKKTIRRKQHWNRNYDCNVPETAARNGKE